MQDGFNPLNRTLGVERNARFFAQSADLRKNAVEVGAPRFLVDDEMIGARHGEGFKIALGLLYHQMHIERFSSVAPHRLDDHRPETDIWDESAIHDIEVNPVGAGAIDGANFFGEMAEIRRQNRRSHNNPPLRAGAGSIEAQGSAPDPATAFQCAMTETSG